jgi:hypothetical protein
MSTNKNLLNDNATPSDSTYKNFCTQVTKPPVSSPCNTNDQYCKDAMAYRDWCSMSKHTSGGTVTPQDRLTMKQWRDTCGCESSYESYMALKEF